MIRISAAIAAILILTGCGTMPTVVRHEVERTAGKVLSREFEVLADAWLVDWLRRISPFLVAAGGASTLSAFLGHKAGKTNGKRPGTAAKNAYRLEK